MNGWDEVGDGLAVEFSGLLILLQRVLVNSGLHQLRLSHATHTSHTHSTRLHLSCDDCLQDKTKDYQNCSVLYRLVYSRMYTDISSSYR